jgi:hypothetical protein
MVMRKFHLLPPSSLDVVAIPLNARLTEQIFDGGFCAYFAQKVTAEICPVQPFVMRLTIFGD